MKNLFLILVVGLLFVQMAEAKPSFGVKGGLNLSSSTQDPDDGLDISRKIGVMLGGVGEVSLNAQNTILGRGEFLDVQKGWKEEGEILGYDYEATANIGEIVLAPSLVFRFPSNGFTPFISGGLELGLNLSAKGEIEFPELDESDKDDIDDWSSTNFGLNIGVGGAIPSGKGEVTLEARYNLGLSNMYTGDDDYTVKTNGIQLIIGYMFSVATK